MHVETVLAEYDFEPDEFASKDGAAARLPNRLSAGVSAATVPVLRRNTAWDFVDIDTGRTRPPVYTVDLTDENFKR